MRKKLGLQPILPKGLTSERDRLYDSEMHKNLPEEDEVEPGEIREEKTTKRRIALHVISLELRQIKIANYFI